MKRTKPDDSWLDDNPLRRWRLKQSPAITQTEAAQTIGCHTSTIRLWETGIGEPQIQYMRRIGELVGIKSVDKLATEWAQWRRRGVRPKPEAA